MRTHILCALLLSCIACIITSVASIPTVAITFSSTQQSAINILVNNEVWFQTGDIFFHANSQYYRVSDNTLQLINNRESNGTDSFGSFINYMYDWSTADRSLSWSTHIKIYSELLTQTSVNADKPFANNIRAIIFEQVWMSDCQNTSTHNDNGVISGFPSFITKPSSDITKTLGYLMYGGSFVVNHHGVWNNGKQAPDVGFSGYESGPVVVFDENAVVTAIISSASEFMSSSAYQTSDHSELQYGTFGSADHIDRGFISSTIMYFDDRGITNTVLAYGDILLQRYHKRREDAYTEFTTNYIGYATDNGAFYYYNTQPNTTYEDTMLHVKNYVKSLGIPFRWFWLDSWWYPKDLSVPGGGGVMEWVSLPSVFPNGLEAFHERMEFPLLAHNRYWAPHNVYAKQNGGNYDFIIEDKMALPTSQIFWDDLIFNGTIWSVRLYLQDWLDQQMMGTRALNTDVQLGKNWLIQMGLAASKNGINILYCTPQPRHLLQSLEIKSVVQVRTTSDFGPGSDQWHVGVGALLDYALGVAPFKDTFWTSRVQPGNPYHHNDTAPHLQSAVATLLAGPVTPSDGIGYTNTTLINYSIRSDGLILKPDRPSVLINSGYIYRAFGSASAVSGEVYETFTVISGIKTYIVFAAMVLTSYKLTPADLYIPNNSQSFITWKYSHEAFDYNTINNFDTINNPIIINANNEIDMTINYITPIYNNKLTLLGEINKWVPLSKQRFTEVTVTNDITLVSVIGSENEQVNIAFVDSNNGTFVTYYASCVFPLSGQVSIIIRSGGQTYCDINRVS